MRPVDIPRARRFPREPIRRPTPDWRKQWENGWWSATTSTASRVLWVEAKVTQAPSNAQFSLVYG